MRNKKVLFALPFHFLQIAIGLYLIYDALNGVLK